MYSYDVLIEGRIPAYAIVTVIAESEEQAEEAALRECPDLPSTAWEADCPVPGLCESGEVQEPMVLEVSCTGEFMLSGWVE